MEAKQVKEMIKGMQERMRVISDCAQVAAKFGHEDKVEHYINRLAVCNRGLKRLEMYLLKQEITFKSE